MIDTVAVTGSTNADLLQRLAAGEALAEGYWLRAEQQSSGRGRSGREWTSEPGNLYTSTLVRLGDGDPAPHTLSMVTAIAVYETLKRQLKANTDIALKWPNDVLVSRAKIAGILLERCNNTVVVGVGINIAHTPQLPGRETTSVQRENPTEQVGPATVLDDLASELSKQLSLWRTEGLASLFERWQSRAFALGTAMSVNAADEGRVEGAFAGIDENGSLILRLASGEMRTIHAGDVSLIARG
ncbi:MAG: biotin--[acetyl-CoA-carboxylase] ligase [Pseudomonadota bacterium]